jgi:uncharacterized membrane protein
MVRPSRTRHSLDVTTAGRCFVWLASGAGLAFLVLTPPLQVPDENRHFNRSYMIAAGDLCATERGGLTGNMLPWSVASMQLRIGGITFDPSKPLDPSLWRAEFDLPLEPTRQVFMQMPTLYSPLPYAPQALGIAMLLPFQPSPVVLLYAARLANFLTWLVLMVVALRTTGSHRWSLALLALSPMSVFLAASASADAATNALAFLWIAVILRKRRARAPLSTVDGVLLWGLATSLGLCKSIYWGLTLLILTLPRPCFSGRRRRVALVLAVLFGSLIPAGAWHLISAGITAPSPEFADPQAQLELLLADPLAVASVLAQTVRFEALRWLQQFVGVLGWLDTPIPDVVYWAYPILLVVIALLERPDHGILGSWERALLVALPVVSSGALLLVAFVAWTAPGDGVISSFQGRYLIPFGPLLVIAAQRNRAPGISRRVRQSAVAVCAGSLVLAIGAAVSRFHGLPWS